MEGRAVVAVPWGEQGTAEVPVQGAGLHLEVPSCLGCSLTERTSPRCAPRGNSETSVCNASFPHPFLSTLLGFFLGRYLPVSLIK